VSWQILAPVLERWTQVVPEEFPNYPAGSWGPEAAEVLIAQDGRSWLVPTVLEEGCETEVGSRARADARASKVVSREQGTRRGRAGEEP
jgi:hypothetical protein